MDFGTLDPGDIISHHRMSGEEHEVKLQRGMNFRLDPRYSVILMSQREGAPYADRVEEDGTVLIYEGHNVNTSQSVPEPASVDQSLAFKSGRPTRNGLFRNAAIAYREGRADAELVKVYEKIRRGIWVFNGVFRLTDCWEDWGEGRRVFKFRLELAEDGPSTREPSLGERSRMIPSAVKLAVWKRDRGRCVICGANDELHFDHIIPYSAGGSSITADNVQILCARHNLGKGDRIE